MWIGDKVKLLLTQKWEENIPKFVFVFDPLCQMWKNFVKCFGPSTRDLSFRLECPTFFIIKICFTIKVNSICGAGRDTKNLCHKFNSQSPALRILDLRVANPKSQGSSSGVLGVRVPVPGSCVSGSCVIGSWSPRSQILESRVSESEGLESQCPRVQSLRISGS